MKRLLSLLALVFTVSLATVAMDAEAAKRLGSGKSMGTQRQAAPDKGSAATNQPAAAPPAAGAAGAAAAAPTRSWLGPVAGLAAGLGLAALASHLGFGGELASMLMMGLLAAAVVVAVGFFVRRRAAAQQPNTALPGGMQYAHVNAGAARHAGRLEQDAPAYKVAMPAAGSGSAIGSAIGSGIGSGIAASSTSAGRIPADFDKAGFERNAKVNFIRLQAANDAANLDDIRAFTTPEMFAELKLELAERGGVTQSSDVVSVSAEVVEVDEDAERYVVSVRFTGVMRDNTAGLDEPFDETWHLSKSRHGSDGWVLSGIQQAVQH